MKRVTLKVLQRLAYENLLLAAGTEPRRRRMTLSDLLEGAREEPRFYQALPTILQYKPSILTGLEKDLLKHPGLKRKAEAVLAGDSNAKDFFGIPAEDCRRSAAAYQCYLDFKRRRNRTHLFNLRLNGQDLESLKKLSRSLHLNNLSETVRHLIHERTLLGS